MDKIVVTYTNGDLDGVASAFAYSEFLNKKGDSSGYYINGKIHKEVDIVCSLLNIKLNNYTGNILNKKIIVVDTNTHSAVSFVSSNQIIEIIDHHPRSNDIFKNATIDIQQIGAVCTIIAEKYKESNISISRESAILLYYGIISNTVNLKSKTTTPRDKEMVLWLKHQCSDIDENLIQYIFTEKTKFNIKDLRISMEVDEIFEVENDKLIIGQLEITKVDSFLEKYQKNINNIINQVKLDYDVSLVFINIIDILEGYHIIYAPDKLTQDYLFNHCGYMFYGSSFKENKIVLRKEIKKCLREN